MSIQVQPRTRLDLVEQAEYYADRADIELAFRFQDCAASTFTLLRTQPHIGKPSPLRHEPLAGVREFPVQTFEKYLISYRATATGILILRVLHGARDISALLEEEPL